MFIKLFLSALPVYVALDVAWVGFLAQKFYRSQVGFLMSDTVNITAVVVFYALFLSGLTFFVSLPAYEKKSLIYALQFGALFGLVTYGERTILPISHLPRTGHYLLLSSIWHGAHLPLLQPQQLPILS